MNIFLKTMFPLFFFIVFFFSCSKKCPCSDAIMPINLISFSNMESDTVIVNRYIKGTNFQSLYGSILLNNTNSYYSSHGDTLEILAYDITGVITSKYDYEVYIPGANKLSKITNVVPQLTIGNCGRCADAVKSYIMNDQAFNSFQLFIIK